MSPEFLSHATVDDEVDGRVCSQKEVVKVGKVIKYNLK